MRRFLLRMKEKAIAGKLGSYFIITTLLLIAGIIWQHLSGDTYYVDLMVFFYFIYFLLAIYDTIVMRISLTGYRFSRITKYGFQLEHRNNYTGYKGIYRGYFIRISIDTGDTLGFPDTIVTTLYCSIDDNIKGNGELTHLIPKNREGGFFQPNFLPNVLVKGNSVRHLAWTSQIFSFAPIKRNIDSVVRLAMRESLAPISEEEANETAPEVGNDS